jgi:hypothetical protein
MIGRGGGWWHSLKGACLPLLVCRRYEGRWKDNMRDGTGKAYSPSGTVLYDGLWKVGGHASTPHHCPTTHGLIRRPVTHPPPSNQLQPTNQHTHPNPLLPPPK